MENNIQPFTKYKTEDNRNVDPNKLPTDEVLVADSVSKLFEPDNYEVDTHEAAKNIVFDIMDKRRITVDHEDFYPTLDRLYKMATERIRNYEKK